MLEHQKKVLKGVSKDKYLFKKELLKSMAWLNAHEQTQLRKWVWENYNHVHSEIIKDVLYPKYEVAM